MVTSGEVKYNHETLSESHKEKYKKMGCRWVVHEVVQGRIRMLAVARTVDIGELYARYVLLKKPRK